MIMLNLFIGIVMNSMSEMHAELEEAKGQDAPAHPQFAAIERQLSALQAILSTHKPTHNPTP